MVSCEALIQQLHSDSPSVQQHAMAVLLVRPLTPQNWLSAVGAIPHLLQLLRSSATSREPLAESQALAIRNFLLYISEYRCQVGGGSAAAPDGVIPNLVSLLLRHGDMDEQHVAALTLSTLSTYSVNHRKIIDAAAITPLVQLLTSSSGHLQTSALTTLSRLSIENEAIRASIAAAGAITPLVQLLRAVGSEKVHAYAIVLLLDLASSDAQPIVAAGAIPPLVKHLTNSSTHVQEQAAYALQTLVARDVNTHAAILAAAPLLPLVGLMTSSSEAVQRHAQQTLLHLSITPTFHEQFVAAGAIPPLVRILHSESASARQRAAVLLSHLSAREPADIFAAVGSAGALPLLLALREDAANLSTAAAVHPASASGSPSAAAAALSPAAASPQQQQEQPLPPRPRKSCCSCGVTGVPLKKCSVCAVASYCSVGCQKADWKAHKGQCAGLKAGASGSGSSAAVGET